MKRESCLLQVPGLIIKQPGRPQGASEARTSGSCEGQVLLHQLLPGEGRGGQGIPALSAACSAPVSCVLRGRRLWRVHTLASEVREGRDKVGFQSPCAWCLGPTLAMASGQVGRTWVGLWSPGPAHWTWGKEGCQPGMLLVTPHQTESLQVRV